MLTQYDVQVNHVAITCYKCGIDFTVPMLWQQRRYESGESFWCPNGHSQAYCESKVAQLKKQLERACKQREWAEQGRKRACEEADRQERRARSYKGHLTRTKKRVGNGVCPCCKRTFQNLQRHMKTKHPSYGNGE